MNLISNLGVKVNKYMVNILMKEESDQGDGVRVTYFENEAFEKQPI